MSNKLSLSDPKARKVIADLLAKDINTDYDAVYKAMAWHEHYQDSSGAHHYKYK